MSTTDTVSVRPSARGDATLAEALRDLGITCYSTRRKTWFKRLFRIRAMFNEPLKIGEHLIPIVLLGVLIFALRNLVGFSYHSAKVILAGAANAGLAMVCCVALYKFLPIYIEDIRQTRWVTIPITPGSLYLFAAPESVVEDARLIMSALPGVTLVIDAFEDDPLLWACDYRERICFAHWGND